MDRPEKILVLCSGSRGDVQPYIALSKSLKVAGYSNVTLGTNANNEKMVKECGVPFRAVFADAETVVKENKELLKSMASGSLVKFMKGYNEVLEEFSELVATNFKQVMEEFQPDLLICNNLTESVGWEGLFWYKVPVFWISTGWLTMNPHRMPFGMPNLPFWGLNSFMMRAVVKDAWSGHKKADKRTFSIKGYKITDMVDVQLWLDELACPDLVPRLLLFSNEMFNVMHPGQEEVVQPVGFAALSPEFQLDMASAESPTHFGCASLLQRVSAFVGEGNEKPIFMGWGSMTCKSEAYMVELVTSAAKLVGCRAIIQAGWAGLSLEALKAATNDQSLIEYAEKSVLFIDCAPHEWLFPQCAVAVHHGGLGTTSTALRAGTPSIITPVFLDQFDTAYAVNQLGAGVGFEKKQFQSIRAAELADAIRKCLTSDEIRAKAKELSLSIRSQDAGQVVAEYVGEFWKQQVKTGRQLDQAKRVLQKFEALKRKRCSDNCACFPRPQAPPKK